MVFVALVKVWAGGTTLPTVPSKGFPETLMLLVPHHPTCLDLLHLSTPAVHYATRKGTTPGFTTYTFKSRFYISVLFSRIKFLILN